VRGKAYPHGICREESTRADRYQVEITPKPISPKIGQSIHRRRNNQDQIQKWRKGGPEGLLEEVYSDVDVGEKGG
jgi:hypothetical protein